MARVLSSAGHHALQRIESRLSEVHFGSDAYLRRVSSSSSDVDEPPSAPDSPTMETPPRLRRARRAIASPQHVQRIWVLQQENTFEEGEDQQMPRRFSIDDSRRVPLAAWVKAL